MLVKLQSAISLFTCGCMVSLAASPSSIGFVVTSGEAHVDGAVVRGNSTLFQGNVVEAGNATSDLMFPGGANLLLQPDSAVKVYREYAVLQKGAVIQRGTHGLVADGLKISSLSTQGAIVVGMKDKSHVEVAARGGPAEVRNPTGALVARLEPGKALSFAIQVSQQNSTSAPLQQNSPPPASGQSSTPAGQAAPPAGAQLTLHGILRKDHPGRYGHYLLTDLATNVTYELQGSGLDDLVGASVEATGSIFDTAPAEGASRVMSVSDIHQMPLGEIRGGTPRANTPAAGAPAPPVETAPGAGPEAGTPPDSGNAPTSPAPLPQHNNSTKIIVIVALAAGAVVGVALGLGGGKSSTVSPE